MSVYEQDVVEDDTRANLIIVTSPAGLLLGTKMRGFGKGKLVLPGGKEKFAGSGFSGKRQSVIDIQEELFEETGLGLPATAFNGVGYLFVEDEDSETHDILIAKTHLPYAPQLTDSEELTDLSWHPLDNLPLDRTPLDYRLWLPHALGNYSINAFLRNIETDFDGSEVIGQLLEPLGCLQILATGPITT